MRDYLICYDITSPKRLAKVYREVLHWATPVELSAFLLHGTQRQRDRCMTALQALIDVRVDDLRCYPLPERGLQERLGKAVLPEGIQWSGLPAASR